MGDTVGSFPIQGPLTTKIEKEVSLGICSKKITIWIDADAAPRDVKELVFCTL